MNTNKKKDFARFLHYFIKLEPVESVGICRMLNIALLNEAGEMKDSNEILKEIQDKFNILDKKQRHRLIKLMEEATRHDGT